MMTVSIVTPSFNQGRFIQRTIESVLSQSDAPNEYVIFDGGSTDNTVEILKQYSDKVTWTSEKDKGQSDAVNKGIQHSKGDIVGWLNSDDIYYPGAISKVKAFFDQHPDVDVIYGEANYIDEHDQLIEQYPTEPWDFERLKYTCFVCQPAVFFRRRTFEKYGLINQSLQYCMDYEYWIRLASKGATIAYLPEMLAGSRLYAETKTLGSRLKVHKEINNMFSKTLGKVPDRWLGNYAHVMTHEKYAKDASDKRKVFTYITMYLYAGLKWNHKIDKTMYANIKNLIYNLIHSK